MRRLLIGRILDQRVLEAIVGLRRRALDEQKVGARQADPTTIAVSSRSANFAPEELRRRPPVRSFTPSITSLDSPCRAEISPAEMADYQERRCRVASSRSEDARYRSGEKTRRGGAVAAGDLKDVGVSAVGDRRRLLAAIAALSGPMPSANAPASSPKPRRPRVLRFRVVPVCLLVGLQAEHAQLFSDVQFCLPATGPPFPDLRCAGR